MFALTLPFLDLIVLNASVRLFCLECPRGPALAVCHHDELGEPVSLLGCQRSLADGKRYSFCCVRLLLCSPSPWASERSMSGNFSIDDRLAILASLGNR